LPFAVFRASAPQQQQPIKHKLRIAGRKVYTVYEMKPSKEKSKVAHPITKDAPTVGRMNTCLVLSKMQLMTTSPHKANTPLLGNQLILKKTRCTFHVSYLP
jgi:hypothetical protein